MSSITIVPPESPVTEYSGNAAQSTIGPMDAECFVDVRAGRENFQLAKYAGRLPKAVLEMRQQHYKLKQQQLQTAHSPQLPDPSSTLQHQPALKNPAWSQDKVTTSYQFKAFNAEGLILKESQKPVDEGFDSLKIKASATKPLEDDAQPSDTIQEGKVQLCSKKGCEAFLLDIDKLRGTTGVLLNDHFKPKGDRYEVGTHYNKVDRLGAGFFGTVDRCVDKRTQLKFVMKKLKKTTFNRKEDGSLVLKLTDFGSACTLRESLNFVGMTPEYLAPEIAKVALQRKFKVLNFGVSEGDVTCKVDVFSFGLVIMYIYKGCHILQKLIPQGQTSYKNFPREQQHLLQILMQPVQGVTDSHAPVAQASMETECTNDCEFIDDNAPMANIQACLIPQFHQTSPFPQTVQAYTQASNVQDVDLRRPVSSSQTVQSLRPQTLQAMRQAASRTTRLFTELDVFGKLLDLPAKSQLQEMTPESPPNPQPTAMNQDCPQAREACDICNIKQYINKIYIELYLKYKTMKYSIVFVYIYTYTMFFCV
ncbi:hypothetical protein MAR_006511 [Mya arenaria]|uniref:Protein kinase domain-containing protein n=1 Tax=Mya arenaria TaxID=6604 RepID=A0ABY7DGA4_MYAAR|nr:hypothetical protein MAR_006511 [Mya arenaria]